MPADGAVCNGLGVKRDAPRHFLRVARAEVFQHTAAQKIAAHHHQPEVPTPARKVVAVKTGVDKVILIGQVGQVFVKMEKDFVRRIVVVGRQRGEMVPVGLPTVRQVQGDLVGVCHQCLLK